MFFPPRLLALLGAALILVPLGAAAQQEGAAEDSVGARVNGVDRKITDGSTAHLRDAYLYLDLLDTGEARHVDELEPGRL